MQPNSRNDIQMYFNEQRAKQQTSSSINVVKDDGTKEYNSDNRLGGLLHLRPRRKKSSGSIHDQWDLKRKQHELMFQFYVLIHLCYADDDTLDTKEQKLIKSMFRKARSVLDQHHFEQIVTYAAVPITLNDVRSYIDTHKLPHDMVQTSIRNITTKMASQKYNTAIRQLTSAFQ